MNKSGTRPKSSKEIDKNVQKKKDQRRLRKFIIR